MSNLENFVKEAEKVSNWYEEVVGDGEDLEGLFKVIGEPEYFSDDLMDYLNSAILGFIEYYKVFRNGDEYMDYFYEKGWINENSSEEWVNQVSKLSSLFGKLTDEERKNLWKSFPNHFSEDPEGDGYGDDGDEDGAFEAQDEVEKEIYENIKGKKC